MTNQPASGASPEDLSAAHAANDEPRPVDDDRPAGSQTSSDPTPDDTTGDPVDEARTAGVPAGSVPTDDLPADTVEPPADTAELPVDTVPEQTETRPEQTGTRPADPRPAGAPRGAPAPPPPGAYPPPPGGFPPPGYRPPPGGYQPPPGGYRPPPPPGGFPPPYAPGRFPPPGYGPPPGGFPPPPPPPKGGAPIGFPPPPPGTGGWATRYGLVRPARGRMLAGVCAAIARASNTDPVLWRVLFAVLTLVGGVGLIAYVIGWLLIPADGDSGSPLEALFGRGRSSTSPVLVVIVGAIAALAVASVFDHGFAPSLFLVALILGAVVLFTRGGAGNQAAGGQAAGNQYVGSAPPGGPPTGPPPGTGPIASPGAGDPTMTMPMSAPDAPATSGAAATDPTSGVGGTPPGDTLPSDTPPSDPVPGDPVPNLGEPVTAGPYPYPPTTPLAGSPVGAPQGGYRPPFAPGGPWAQSSPYPYPGLISPPPPPPPPVVKKDRPPSRLGRLTFSMTLLVLGVLALIDVIGNVRIPASGYVAAALTTIGLGLLIGAWFGRARWLITLGILLSLLLAATTAASHTHFDSRNAQITWVPTSVSDISDRYEHSVGSATLDLRQVNFTGESRTVTVRVNAGEMRVLLPPNVDVTVNAKVNLGNAKILGNEWGGVGSSTRTIRDDGADGPGGGTLTLDVAVNAGQLEVNR